RMGGGQANAGALEPAAGDSEAIGDGPLPVDGGEAHDGALDSAVDGGVDHRGQLGELGAELSLVGNHRAGRERWRAEPVIDDLIAKGAVALMADRGDDRFRARADGAAQALVAEGKQLRGIAA